MGTVFAICFILVLMAFCVWLIYFTCEVLVEVNSATFRSKKAKMLWNLAFVSIPFITLLLYVIFADKQPKEGILNG